MRYSRRTITKFYPSLNMVFYKDIIRDYNTRCLWLIGPCLRGVYELVVGVKQPSETDPPRTGRRYRSGKITDPLDEYRAGLVYQHAACADDYQIAYELATRHSFSCSLPCGRGNTALCQQSVRPDSQTGSKHQIEAALKCPRRRLSSLESRPFSSLVVAKA